ncbi:amidohydrolase family protein [Peristeroidobacter soli]|uniref:amidohydrolase family protein n=1 Tax=Peristeroidobacter soli TaxID=2497877 RepID=UPI00101DDBBC|nr:amidohydrolase family protein [Peristeroidobacter soli]
MKARVMVFVLAVLLGGPVVADSLLIQNGRIHTQGPAGVIERGSILIENGRIRAVGATIPVPAGAQVIDATNRIVTPGFFDPLSVVGLIESVEDEANDASGAASADEIADAVNFNSPSVAIDRRQGVTRAVVTPRLGKSLIGGVSALVRLTGAPDMVFERHASLNLLLGEAGATGAGGSRAGTLARLQAASADASIKDAVARKVPIVVAVDREADIRLLIPFAREHGWNLIVAGGAEAWRAASVLAQAKVPVIVRPTENLPNRWELMGATLANAARLNAAGVRIAFAQAEGDIAPPLSQLAGVAVAHGLPWEQGLAAVTSNPARMWGVADRLGSLQVGYVADVVVWDGDPLETTSAPVTVIIEGIVTSLTSRQTELRDRYLK